MEINKNEITSQKVSQDFDFKKVLSTYTKQWKWFVFCILISIGIAFLYIRYTPPEFLAYAKVMLVDDAEASAPSAALQDLSIFADKDNARIEDEIEVAKSRLIIKDVINQLDLNVQCFLQGTIYETELYDSKPFNINFIASDSIVNNKYFNCYIDVLSEVDFNYRIHEDDVPVKKSFGENIAKSIGGVVLTPRGDNFDRLIGKTVRLQVTPINSLIQYYKFKINIEQIEKSSRIVSVSLQDQVKSKAMQVVNALIDSYNKNTIAKKNEKSKNTADFIDERINLIAADLAQVDDSAERFKTSNKLTDITSEAGLYLDYNSQSEQELSTAQNELNVINFMKDQVGDSNDPFSPVPLNLGVTDPSVSATAQKYNEILQLRQQKIKGSSDKNPIVVNLDQQLNTLRNSLRQSLNSSASAIGIKVRNLQNQINKISSKIYAVPGQTRELRDIQREQGTKEALYIYLLQKREEATISLTATSPNAIVIDEAYGKSTPVSPNKKIILLAAAFLGFLVPFGFIYVGDLLDSKIHNKEDLIDIIKNITVLGEVPRIKGNNSNTFIKRNDRSLLSESFRIIRTNFDYVKRSRSTQKYNNVLFVTSTINGEGKSFFSINMALTLANTGKKVLLVGGDIRNPQTHTILKKGDKDLSKIGLTDYITDGSINIKNVVNTYQVNDITIDALFSGKVPPNPAELLMSDRIEAMFDTVSEQYDYVVVDTAPSMLVTDTLLFSQYAGHTIYLTRADYTEKRILNFAKELHEDKKLNGMMLVVNDVKQSNFGYGAKYGYYGTPKKKKWYSLKKA